MSRHRLGLFGLQQQLAMKAMQSLYNHHHLFQNGDVPEPPKTIVRKNTQEQLRTSVHKYHCEFTIGEHARSERAPPLHVQLYALLQPKF